jgi:hypothetical protein
MKPFKFRKKIALLPAVAALSAAGAAVLVSGQTPVRAPRTADGHPDLSGIWQALNTANWNLEDHVAAAGPAYQMGAVGATPGGLGVVEGGAIPYRPEALAKKKENYANRWARDPEVKCYLPGIPRANYMPYPFQILQTPTYILMAYEYAKSDRAINMGKPVEAQIDTWMGTANGRWDGETLVVDNTGFNDGTWFDRAGNFHSEELHVVERFTRIDADHLRYEATIEDPQVFTRAWKIGMPLYRRVEKNAQLTEFNCIEFAEELLYGDLRKKPAIGAK